MDVFNLTDTRFAVPGTKRNHAHCRARVRTATLASTWNKQRMGRGMSSSLRRVELTRAHQEAAVKPPGWSTAESSLV